MTVYLPVVVNLCHRRLIRTDVAGSSQIVSTKLVVHLDRAEGHLISFAKSRTDLPWCGTVPRGKTAVPHLSALALRGLTIMMVNPFDLRDALDASTDLRHDLGDTMEEDFPILLIDKEKDQTAFFKHSLTIHGIQEPITVIIMPDGSWQMDDGHNRLKFGLLNNVDVPVVFDDTGAGEESTMRYEVERMDSVKHYDEGPAGWEDTIKIDAAMIHNLIPFPRSGELPKIVARAR